jgi:3-hydroxyisobutyrate dehydrogenase-like beta-hydroxyacid dehydrogenase
MNKEPRMNPRVCLVGFGEVGQALAAELRPRVERLTAWDLKFTDAASPPSRAALALGMLSADAAQAVADANVIISAVTAAQISEAARSAAPHLAVNAWYFDLNSTSPAAKRQAGATIDAAGGRYVEAAIMSPIAPRGAASPMLLGGAHAEAFLPWARQLGFTGAEVLSGKLGAASAAKMCRSVVVKGLEALILESLLSARRHGVEEAVLASLQGLRIEDWRKGGRYMISRALVHGKRRAEEMREVARTVSEAGLEPRMSGACAQWQQWAGEHSTSDAHEDLAKVLDGLLAANPRVGAP